MRYNDFSFQDYRICSPQRLRHLIEVDFGVDSLVEMTSCDDTKNLSEANQMLSEHDTEQLMSDLRTHIQLIFEKGMLPLYGFDSPELAERIPSTTEYHQALRELVTELYREGSFYSKTYGRFDGSITATTLSMDEFILQIILVIFTSDSSQIVQSIHGWESKTAKFSRCFLPKCINIASVQTRKDYYTYLWLVSCIEQYLRLDIEGLNNFWYTHKLSETKDRHYITVTRRMFNNLLKNQQFERDGLFEPGVMFDLPTPLPEPAQIFYQIMHAAKAEYRKAKI